MTPSRLLPNSLPQLLVAAVIGLLVSAHAGNAAAATLYVANDGADGATCGAKTDPCRSMSKVMANAVAGDKIIVGPGRYGDLNGDGLFDQPGEESPQIGTGCFCMIHINKRVTVVSRDGAAATVLHAGGADVDVVRVSADGATFGGFKKGFTLTGSGRIAGLALPVISTGVTVVGNVSVANSGNGFQILGDLHVIKSNLAIANGFDGFSTGNAQGVLFDGNVAIANGTGGFRIESTLDRDHVLTRNVSSGNGTFGFFLRGFDYEVTRNVASANGSTGFIADSPSDSNNHELEQNTAVGNVSSGISLTSPIGDGALTSNNLLGNFNNCGLSGSDVDASKSYWGAADGPGADPADDVCGVSVIVDPVSKKEKKVKAKWPKL